MKKYLNEEVLLTTIFSILITWIIAYQFIPELKDSVKLLGLGIGFLGGFYFVLISINADGNEKTIWRRLKYISFPLPPIILIIINTELFLGYVIAFGISAISFSTIASYAQKHQ